MSSYLWGTEAKKPFRILALDGGGVRAIIQTTIIQRLCQYFPDLLTEVDMFTGTSAGGIVAGALSIGISPDEIGHLWTNEVAKIFSCGYRRTIGNLDSAIGASYYSTELEKMLRKMVGEKTLKDLKPKFLSPSFQLEPTKEQHNPRWHPVYFHNFANSTNADAQLADVILRTAAAPTYFPIRDGFVDGGTFANNPSMIAVTTALSSGIKIEDISVFSISTGLNPRSITKAKIGTGDWGLLEWGPHIIDLLLDSTTQSIDYECKCLLKDNYRRLDPLLPFDVGLDDALAVPELMKVAHKVDLSAVIDWIEVNWKLKRVSNPDTIPLELSPPLPKWNCSIQ